MRNFLHIFSTSRWGLLFFGVVIFISGFFGIVNYVYAEGPPCCYEEIMASSYKVGGDLKVDVYDPPMVQCKIISSGNCLKQPDFVDGYFTYNVREPVSCTSKPVCAANLNSAGIITDISSNNTISVQAGEKGNAIIVHAVNAQIECINCSANFTTLLTNNGQTIVTFNSAEYINAEKLQASDLPSKVMISILGQLNSNFKYFEIIVTINPLNCAQFDGNESGCKNPFCLYAKSINKCLEKGDSNICSTLSDEDCAKSSVCEISPITKKCTQKTDAAADKSIIDKYGKLKDYQGPLPDCAFSGTCRDVNELIQLVVNFGTKVIFPVVAGLAFVFFVYGGFTMILSFGNSEKVQKGQQILVAAVIGLVIVFSAYILIKFLLTALGVQQGFIGIT